MYNKLIEEDEWGSIIVKDIGTMGTSVIAFVNIKEGEIICRYPGKIRSGNRP